MRSVPASTFARLASAAALVWCAGFAIAGPIDPPAGAISSTFKTLGEVEPRIAVNATNTPGDGASIYKITQPGSYYVTGNIAGAAGKSAILIAADDVTLDLSGYSLNGQGVGFSGVKLSGFRSGVTVKNGTARGWMSCGFDLVDGSSCRAEGLTAVSNSQGGILMGIDSLIVDGLARLNGSHGIAGTSGVTMRNCVSAENDGNGFFASEGATISGCTSRTNTGRGFYCSGTSSVSNCTAVANGIEGFLSGYGSSITGCIAKDNDGHGFWLYNGSMVSASTAYSNGGDGFLIWGSIDSCQASQNGGDGIRLEAIGASAVNNTCMGNGTVESGAGVRASTSGCRVDSNQCYGNDYGIVAAPDVIVVRNSARANGSGNYSFPSGSEYGQILTNPGNGFAATNPWANFAY